MRSKAEAPKPNLRFDPLNDCIVFRLVDSDRTLSGRLHLPEISESRKRAVVVSVGPGKLQVDGTRVPVGVSPGDRIVVWAHAPMPKGIDVTGETLFFCRAEDVAARVVDALELLS